MQQIARQFAERLNHALDNLDIPTPSRERAVILSKMVGITKQQAWSLLEGHVKPDAELLQQLADELEVETEWLLGE